MTYKAFLYLMLFSVVIASCHHDSSVKQATDKPGITELLHHPLGTLLKMDVEVFDGNLTQRKEYTGTYLLKIKSINNKQQEDTVLISFRDETGKFPANDFELYKYLYGKDTSTLSSDQSDKMKKEYVGKTFKVVAYETGEFTGVPKGYFDYLPERAEIDFHFKNYLIVVADLTKEN